MSTKCYEIIAEYGPIAADHIKFYIHHDSPYEAKRQAIRILKKDYAVYWPRIGKSNVHVRPRPEAATEVNSIN